ncbi:MAG: protein kinase, partial [Cyanobacteria bacterium J06649_4]
MSSKAIDHRIIDQRYRIVSILGEGSSGTTYLAQRVDSGEEVALKELSLRSLSGWKMLELFEREISLLKALDHPAIPKYVDSFVVETERDRHFYLAQTIAPGKSLFDWIESGWRCTEAEAINISEQLLNILTYLQSLDPPVIHRDLKPQNIIRNEDGQIALVDFGAVGHTYHNTFMRGSTVVGTFGYMAPEQFRGQAYPATDLYSLGTTLLFLLTRRSPSELPVQQLTIQFQTQVNLSPAFSQWLELLLAPSLEKRLRTAQTAQLALKHRSIRQLSFKVTHLPKVYWLILVLLALTGFASFSHRYRYALLDAIGHRDFINAALIKGNLSASQYLASGGRIKTKEDRQLALLTAALRQNNYELAAELTVYKINLNSHLPNNQTLLHILVREKNIDAIRFIKSVDPDLNLNVKNAEGTSLLSTAPNEDIALELLDLGAQFVTSETNASGRSFLEYVISRDWHAVTERYLSHIESDSASQWYPESASGSDVLS